MKKKRHAGAEARRASEQANALGVAADPKKATGAELVRAVTVERQAMAEDVARAKTLPAAEVQKVLPQLQEQRDRIVALDAELARRPALVKSPDGLPVNLNAARPAESKEAWFTRWLGVLGIEAGVAKREPSGGTVTLSKEEEMQARLARLRRDRGADPKSTNVAAAVAGWLVGNEGWPWVAGTADELATLEDRDVAALLVALGLIANHGENGSVTVPARSPLRGTRIRCEGFLGGVEHLAANRLLAFERRLPDVTIGYGPLLLDIAKAAGVTVPSGDGDAR